MDRPAWTELRRERFAAGARNDCFPKSRLLREDSGKVIVRLANTRHFRFLACEPSLCDVRCETRVSDEYTEVHMNS